MTHQSETKLMSGALLALVCLISACASVSWADEQLAIEPREQKDASEAFQQDPLSYLEAMDQIYSHDARPRFGRSVAQAQQRRLQTVRNFQQQQKQQSRDYQSAPSIDNVGAQNFANELSRRLAQKMQLNYAY